MPSDRARAAMVKRLEHETGQLISKIVDVLSERHPWYQRLGAEERSWITVLARAGVDNFLAWFTDDPQTVANPASLFNAAPRALARKISLHQTVELVRTTVDVVEEEIGRLIPRNDRAALQTAILYYSREVAFAAAEIYARAAENRGAWDDRIEALVVDAIVRGETDETLVSRASALGWEPTGRLCVIVGPASTVPDLEGLRRAGSQHQLSVLASVQGDRLVTVLGGSSLADESTSLAAAEKLIDWFGPGRVVVGPLVDDLRRAADSARAALSGARSAVAWPEGPRVLSARDLLPERTVAGNVRARRELVEMVFAPLVAAGGDLLATCVSLLAHGGSVEATGRALFVHPNTVRYRIRRIHDVTGYSPSVPREAYVLQLAITLGRLQRS